MKKNVAKRLLENAGWNVLEQRGFYSHFLRVRHHVNMQTQTTLEIGPRDGVNNDQVYRLVRMQGKLSDVQRP